MPRGSRSKSHRQHHKQSAKDLEDSDEGENTRYGPELLLETKAEGKRGKEEGKLEFSKEKHEIQKRKSQPQSRELGPGSSSATYYTLKRKRGAVEHLEVDGADVQAVSVSVDRWNGGETQGDALSLLPYHSRTDSESSDRNIGAMDDKDDVRTEDKGKKSVKGRVPDAGGSGSTKIDVPDSLYRRNKGSRRRETQDSAVDQGSSLKLEEVSPQLAKVDSDASNIGKLEFTKSGTKGRWDKGMARKESKEADEGTATGTSSRDVQRGSDREKKVRSFKQEKTTASMAGPARNYEGQKNEGSLEELLIKQEQKFTEWQLQEEVRNIELEKELENRIQRRREESGERDRWREDDRDLEGKRFYRDERKRDDRYKDEKQKDDRYKDDRHRDERHRDDKYKEEKYTEDHHRGEKHQENKHREWRLSRERTTEKYDNKNSRDGSRVPEGRYKENKHYESDRDYSSHYDDQYTQHRDHRDQSRLVHTREDSRDTKILSNKVSASEGDCKGSSTGHPDENVDHEKLLLVLPISEAGDSVNDKKLKRVRGIGTDALREEHRLKFKQSDSESKDTLSEEKPNQTRNERLARNLEQLSNHSREPGILHCKNKTEKKPANHRDESPLGSARSSAYDGRTSPVLSHVGSPPKNNGRLSPINMAQRSQSPYVQNLGPSLSYEKVLRKNKFETGNNASGVGGMRKRNSYCVNSSDRDKQQSLTDEMGSREPQVLYRSTEDHKRSPSTDRVNDSQINNSALDESSRGPYGSSCRVGNNLDLRRMPSRGSSPSCERPSKGCRLEQGSSSRSDWTVHPTSLNRPMESSVRPQVPSLTGRPSGLLPPPPPFRPGIDNPAILGPSSSGFDEAPSSIDQRRADRQVGGHFKRGEVMGGSGHADVWKGVGNWNSHGQAQGPGNMFIPFQHHIGGHPHRGFLNMGQQFPGPPLFGVRPSSDMGSVRYHMRDGGDAFPVHNRNFGWQRQTDDVCGPHIQVPLHGWEGPGSYGEESHAYGRTDREQIGQGISARSWDRATDMWKANPRETDEAWGGPQVLRGRIEKIRRERSPTESIEIKRSDEGPPKVIKENECSTLVPDVRKQSKNRHNRMSVYLSKLDISAGLAGRELYDECVEILDSRENNMSKNDAVLKDGHTEDPVEDIQLEVDAVADALLQSLNMQSIVFPSLPKDIFQRAFALYKNATGESKLEHAGHTRSNSSVEEQHNLTETFESSKQGSPTKVYDKTNVDVDVAIIAENTSTDLVSAMELRVSQGDCDMKNWLQKNQEDLGMASQGDARVGLSTNFNAKEPGVNVIAVGDLDLPDDVNMENILEQPAGDVNAGVCSAELEDDVTNLELVSGHCSLGLSKEMGTGLDATVFPEEPVYGIKTIHFSRELVDSDNAMNFLDEQVDYVNPVVPEESSKASSEENKRSLIENMEESKCTSSASGGNAGLTGTENSPKGLSVIIDKCVLITEPGNAVAFVEHSVVPYTDVVRKCEAEAENNSNMHNSKTFGEVSEFHERPDDEDFNTDTSRHTDRNQQVEDLCAETGVQQDESPENTDIVLEKPVESVDSKIGIRSFSPYNLPGSTH